MIGYIFFEWNCCVGGEQCFAKVCCVLLRVYRLYGVLLCFLKRYLFIGNIGSALLTVLPFFAITVYFKNFSVEIFTLASYLLLLISVKELVKDLCNIKGDLSNNYKTIPTVYGENSAKRLIFPSSRFLFGVFFLLYFFFPYKVWSIIFWLAWVFFCFTILVWVSSKPKQLILLLFGIKALIVLGLSAYHY